MTEPPRRPDERGTDQPQADHGRQMLTDPGSAARVGDLAGILTFLDWMQTHAAQWGKRPRTVQLASDVWRLAGSRLALPATTAIDDADLAAIAERLTSVHYCGHDPTRTMRIYGQRLARSREWHRRWRAGDPDWARRTYLPNPVMPRPRPAKTTAVTYQFPLRRDRRVTVELPRDLSSDELDVLCAWIRTLAGP